MFNAIGVGSSSTRRHEAGRLYWRFALNAQLPAAVKPSSTNRFCGSLDRHTELMHKNNHKLRVGIVGAGNIVRTRHLPALEKNPDVEIVAVSNSTYESSEKFCREYSLSALPIHDWAELVATPDIDIVWIGTTPYMHSAVTISALEAGKHVFCQARMSMDLAEADEMLAASKRYPELVTMLCPPPFGLRGDLMVKKILAENYIGQSPSRTTAKFPRQFLGSRGAGALATKNRDQWA